MSETTQAITVTLPLSGLPDSCPHTGCGYVPPDGQWVLGVQGTLLQVICPSCRIRIAPVMAVAATDPDCE